MMVGSTVGVCESVLIHDRVEKVGDPTPINRAVIWSCSFINPKNQSLNNLALGNDDLGRFSSVFAPPIL